MAEVGSTPTPGSNAEPTVESKVFQFAFHLRKEGYRDQTIERSVRLLKRLSKQTDLSNQEKVKASLAQLNWSLGTKEVASNILANFYKFQGVPFSKPHYTRVEKVPFLPQEEEVTQLIQGCSKPVASFLQFLRETGARAGEAWATCWRDMDLEVGRVSIVPEKYSNPRVLKLSPRLCGIIGSLPRKRERVWACTSLKNWSAEFFKQRSKVARETGNPRIRSIHFHTFRHLKGSMEYHKTRDIIHVQRTLGHKSIKSTMVYIQLLEGLGGEDSFTCKVARNLAEASQLVEAGFDYVTELDGVKLFRKRK